MNKTIIALAILAASAAAHATYGGPGEPPYPPGEGPQQPAATVPSSTSNATSNSNAGAAAQSASRSAADSASTSRATGGNAQGGSARQGQAQGQSSRNSQRSAQSATMAGGAVTVDAADRSSTRIDARVNIIQGIVPATPPSFASAGETTRETGACGPLQTVVSQGINGYFFNAMGGTEIVPLGQVDTLTDYYSPVTGLRQTYEERRLPDGRRALFGHQPIVYTVPLMTSGARNVAFGGWSSSGGAQAGGGGSAAMSQFSIRIVLRLCEIETKRAGYGSGRRRDRN